MMQKLKGGIIVSCQSKEGDPTHCPEFMAAFAKSAFFMLTSKAPAQSTSLPSIGKFIFALASALSILWNTLVSTPHGINSYLLFAPVCSTFFLDTKMLKADSRIDICDSFLTLLRFISLP